MLKLLRFLTCALLCIGCVMNSRGQENGLKRADAQLLALRAATQQGTIGQVEIIRIPAEVLTRTRVTPEMLEKQYHYKLTIREIENYRMKSKLFDAVGSLALGPTERTGDLRWGIIFYKKDGTRLCAIYADAGGSVGSVDLDGVFLKGDLISWLRSTLAKCLD
jgi:hypothetical protein